MSAGKVSMIVDGLLMYKGSMNFSRLDKYFTLSLASLNASVIPMSTCFHRRSDCARDWRAGTPGCSRRVTDCSTLNTCLRSLVRSCSVIDVIFCKRMRQKSSSVLGPGSPVSFCWLSRGSSRYCSIIWHHESSKRSYCSRRAVWSRTISAGCKVLVSTVAASGLGSSIPADNDLTPSERSVVKRWKSARKPMACSPSQLLTADSVSMLVERPARGWKTFMRPVLRLSSGLADISPKSSSASLETSSRTGFFSPWSAMPSLALMKKTARLLIRMSSCSPVVIMTLASPVASTISIVSLSTSGRW
mmetsp:Transcript_39932/g.120715  ORF Transcript_39932/g.120715 Transcript_39932/m.120715 type:complete len:303 (+) Transcript_39932:1913-2821(+)